MLTFTERGLYPFNSAKPSYGLSVGSSAGLSAAREMSKLQLRMNPALQKNERLVFGSCSQ
jgi:hypothetical protein